MATSYQEAVEKTIIASEQLNQIVNGTATAEVVVEDGSKIPSVRKALVDNFYFKDPLTWQQGQSETVFNQLRKFSDGTLWYAPTATTSNVVTMGVTPVGDPLWKVYSLDAIPKLTPQIREALRRSYAEAGYTLVAGSFETGGTLTGPNDVLLQEFSGRAYSGPTGVVAPGTNPASGAFVDRGSIQCAMATTVALANGAYSPGSRVIVLDRDDAVFNVVYGGVPNGYTILNAGNGNTAKLSVKSRVNVKAAGAAGNGDPTIDDAIPIMHAIEYARSHAVGVYVPAGDYTLLTSLRGDASGFDILGAGRNKTFLTNRAASDAIVIDGGASYINDLAIKGLTIRGDWDKTQHTGTTGHGLRLRKVGNGSKIEDCDILCNRSGLWVEDSYTINVDNCRSQWNGEYGYWSQSGSNSINHIGCQYNFNGKSGARLGGNAQNLYGCNVEGNEENGVIFNGRGHNIFGGYYEKPAGEPFAFVYVDGCVGWGVHGAFLNDLGGKPLTAGKKYLGVAVVNSSEGEVDKATIMLDSTGNAEHVRFVSGTNNVAYLEEDEAYTNTAGATNRVVFTTRLQNERGGIVNVADGGVITHSCGVIPTKFTFTPIGDAPIQISVKARTDDTFTVGVFDSNGTPVATPRPVSWTASY